MPTTVLGHAVKLGPSTGLLKVGLAFTVILTFA